MMDTKENICKKPAKMVVILSLFFFLIFKLAQQISSFQCWVSLNMMKKKKFIIKPWGFRGSLPLFCRGWKVVDLLYKIVLLLLLYLVIHLHRINLSYDFESEKICAICHSLFGWFLKSKMALKISFITSFKWIIPEHEWWKLF